MFICEDCGDMFSEPEIATEIEHYEYWGANITHKHHYIACPSCGSYYINEMPEEAGED